jgi:hypothetical protein
MGNDLVSRFMDIWSKISLALFFCIVCFCGYLIFKTPSEDEEHTRHLEETNEEIQATGDIEAQKRKRITNPGDTQRNQVRPKVSECVIPNKTLIIDLKGWFTSIFGFRDTKTITFSNVEPSDYLGPRHEYFKICHFKTRRDTYNYLMLRREGNFKNLKFLDLNVEKAYEKFRTSNWGSVFKVKVDVTKEEKYWEILGESYFFGKLVSFSVE